MENNLLNDDFSLENLLDNWQSLTHNQREQVFMMLGRIDQEELFINLSSDYQAEIFELIPHAERRSWIRLLAPDDIADLIQNLFDESQAEALRYLDYATLVEVKALLAYAEDEAGGLMNSRFARLRPEMTVEEAIRYLRAQSKSHIETIYYAYVLDRTQILLGVISLRELFLAKAQTTVEENMNTDLVTILQDEDQESISKTFSNHNLLAIPVVDENNVMKGIITVDDVVEVIEEEATEDIQKIGGMEALGEPYLDISLPSMIKKRAGWLMALFIGEMFTATAMSHYEHDIAKAVVLALFIPLVISSGGNSGSQATTLIIRAMALGEVRLRDWWRVLNRELISGVCLGLILGSIGLMRILLWPGKETLYGEHYVLVAVTVACSLVGIVLWGTLAGSMLPFLLRRLGLDPATSSAPFVATLVDVTGLVIYFTVASLFLKGILL
ncbi:magnesium transporter [Bacteriovorax sp. PP10]|uniref:Magnesium transporter MgtE n=1 Tax=Bacteriovorax antarcticus TaxID=3088717 RepID=A0ABU5VY13_9BACT|nr:magnesium transporter [Bacteriovorax sp. PP10]MEA9357497.1 magnesium transporter [Bacteriovorax sp. PP10]